MAPETVRHENPIAIWELCDRLLIKFTKKGKVGEQSLAYQAATEILNDFAIEIIKSRSLSELSPNAEFMLNFLEKIREISRTPTTGGRISGKCLFWVDQMIAFLRITTRRSP